MLFHGAERTLQHFFFSLVIIAYIIKYFQQIKTRRLVSIVHLSFNVVLLILTSPGNVKLHSDRGQL